MGRSAHSGFTLVELLVALGVFALLVGIGVPGLSALVQNNRMTASVNDLVATLQLARSEAVKRRQPIAICHSDNAEGDAECGGNGWQDGWLVWVDDDDDRQRDADELVLRASGGLGKNLIITAQAGADDDTALVESMTFQPSGFPRDIGGGNLLFCDARASDDHARVVNLSPTGRAQARMPSDVGGLTISCEDA